MTRLDEEVYWDPFDTRLDTEPYDTWRRMRDEAPVYRNERFDFFALSRFADVNAAHRDPATFLSGRGTVLELMGHQLDQQPGMMIFMDPPQHDSLRALVSRAFTPRRVGALEERVRAVCREHLDPQVGGEGFDYLQDFGAQLPSKIISSLLGVPDADRPRVLELIDTVFYIEPEVGMINDVSLGAQIELNAYLQAQLAERRARPRDDLLTALVEAELSQEDGAYRRLNDVEGAGFANLLVSAGTETVARLLGWAAVVLDAHPDQRDELARDPSLIPNTVEELLRFEAPSPVQGRWTSGPVELHGELIPPDSKVLLLTGSAGRDERAYPDPDHFDIHRRFDQHVSFGIGPHFCLGAALARLEGRVALEETLARFPRWEVDHERAVRLHTSTVRGYKQVPIRL
ncbi:MAG TPA: cytochrome P450 [Acidimicrobiales bacterium]|nr:cytochrome P450 [Acidimicrobiales bacterium]